jgi:phosphatidylglycerophosphatase A
MAAWRATEYSWALRSRIGPIGRTFRQATGLQLRSHSLSDWTVLILATGLGIGLVPVMPGTFGTLLGLPLAWVLDWSGWPKGIALAAIGVLFLLGIPLCGRAAHLLGRPDPGCVVFDEIAAFPLVFLLERITLTTAILGFVWFRIFDITKPWPVRRLERLHGGLGIMIDDVMAAIYAAIALWLTIKVWHALPWGAASE